MHSFGTTIFFLFCYSIVYIHGKPIVATYKSLQVWNGSTLVNLRGASRTSHETFSDAQPVVEYKREGLTQGQMIGIGVGFGAGGAFCIMTLVAVWERRQFQRQQAAKSSDAQTAQRKAHLHAIARSLKEAKKYNSEEGEKPMQGVLLIPTPRKDIDLLSTDSGGRGSSTDHPSARTPNARTPISVTTNAATPHSSPRNSIIVPYIFTTTPSLSIGQISATPRENLLAYVNANTPPTPQNSLSNAQSPSNSLSSLEGTPQQAQAGECYNCVAVMEGAVSSENTRGTALDRNSTQIAPAAASSPEVPSSPSAVSSERSIARREPPSKPVLRLPIPHVGGYKDTTPYLDSTQNAHSSAQDSDAATARERGGVSPNSSYESFVCKTGDRSREKSHRLKSELSAEPISSQGSLAPVLRFEDAPFEDHGNKGEHSAKSSADRLEVCARKEDSRSPRMRPQRRNGSTPAQNLERIPLTELVTNIQVPPSSRLEAEMTYRAQITSEVIRESKVHALAEYVKRVTTSEGRAQ